MSCSGTYFAASGAAADTVASISAMRFCAGSFWPAHAARTMAAKNTMARAARVVDGMGCSDSKQVAMARILAQFAPRAFQPLGLGFAVVGGAQFCAVEQILEDAPG